MFTGLPVDASGASPSASRARAAARRRLDPEARRLAGVRAEDPRTAGVGQHHHSVATRQRLVREQARDVEHLPHRLGAQDAGMGEQRVDGDVGGGEQRPGARRRGTLAGRRAAALDRNHRLVLGDPAHDPSETARVAERREIERQHRGLLVLLPVLEEVVAGEIGLVAHRDEGGEPDPARRRLVDGGDPERCALGGERDIAGRHLARCERGVEGGPVMEVGDPEAVGADHAHAGGPADGEQLVLPRAALRAYLGEPGRQDDERPHALRRALAYGLEHRRGGDRDHRELDVAFDVGDRANRWPAGDLSVAQIDEVQRPREASGHQVAHDLATQGSGPARRPDDRDRRGSQDVSDGRDVRDALVILEVPPRIGRQRGRELELDDIVHRWSRPPRSPNRGTPGACGGWSA